MTWEHAVIVLFWLIGWLLWEAATEGKGKGFAWLLGAAWPILVPLLVLAVLLDSRD
jgi:hypothetical protein